MGAVVSGPLAAEHLALLGQASIGGLTLIPPPTIAPGHRNLCLYIIANISQVSEKGVKTGVIMQISSSAKTVASPAARIG